jgi:hypothetical protein
VRVRALGRYILHPGAERRKLVALKARFRRLAVDRPGCRKAREGKGWPGLLTPGSPVV